MSKPFVIVIHGMGSHAAETLKSDVEDTLNPIASQFAALNKNATKAFSDHVEMRYITYDDVWNDARERIATKVGTMADRLTGFGIYPSAIARLTSLEKKFNDDSFWFTHLLDVILYRTMIGQQAQIEVAKQIVDMFIEANAAGTPCHFIGHSLGTALLHDTLFKLHRKKFAPDMINPDKDYRLIPGLTNSIDSITMIANVSQLFDKVGNVNIKDPDYISPYKTNINPGPQGICLHFINVLHRLDPIPILYKFKPYNHWNTATLKRYHDIDTKRCSQLNVHSLSHYLKDPLVYGKLFDVILIDKFFPTEQELKDARDKHHQSTALGHHEDFVDALEGLELDIKYDKENKKLTFIDNESINKFEHAVTELRDFIDSLEA